MRCFSELQCGCETAVIAQLRETVDIVGVVPVTYLAKRFGFTEFPLGK